jgi:RNase P subunit RPR2
VNVSCDHCGVSFNHPTKKFTRRKGKTHKIVVCPSCSSKNFVPVIQKYSEKS